MPIATSVPLVDLLLKLAKAAQGLVENKKKLKKERREAIAGYLDSIGNVLIDISTELRNKKLPKRLCDELERYAWQVDEFLDEVELGTRLELRTHIEFAQMGPLSALSAVADELSVIARPDKNSNPEKDIRKIEKASAIFKTTAQRLRIPK